MDKIISKIRHEEHFQIVTVIFKQDNIGRYVVCIEYANHSGEKTFLSYEKALKCYLRHVAALIENLTFRED